MWREQRAAEPGGATRVEALSRLRGAYGEDRRLRSYDGTHPQCHNSVNAKNYTWAVLLTGLQYVCYLLLAHSCLYTLTRSSVISVISVAPWLSSPITGAILTGRYLYISTEGALYLLCLMRSNSPDSSYRLLWKANWKGNISIARSKKFRAVLYVSFLYIVYLTTCMYVYCYCLRN